MTNYEWYLNTLEERHNIDKKLQELEEDIIKDMKTNRVRAVAVSRYNKVIMLNTSYLNDYPNDYIETRECEVIKDES